MYLVVVLVYLGILHDFLYLPLFGEQVEFVKVSRVGEVFCRYCEKELLLYVLHRYRLDAYCFDFESGFRVNPGDDLRVDGPMDEGLVAFLFFGKARGLSLPNRMETCPEWEEMALPVHALHFFGVGNE